MELDYERAKEKTAELVAAVERVFYSTGASESSAAESHQAAVDVVSNYASIVPPEKEPVLIHLVTMNIGGHGGGESTKLGNVGLNMKKLCIAVSKGAFATVATLKTPWLTFFAALILWDEFWSCTKAPLSEDDALVLYAMWMNKDSEQRIAANDVETKVNAERAKVNQPPLSTAQIRSSIKTLEQIRCIKRAKDAPSKWWLCEWVSFTYR